jgi:predicted DNA-binding transcriptional regulator AlpA
MSEDRVIYRRDLCAMLGIGSEALRRWMKAGKLPAPDIAITRRAVGWRLSTLQAAGIRPVSQSAHACIIAWRSFRYSARLYADRTLSSGVRASWPLDGILHAFRAIQTKK